MKTKEQNRKTKIIFLNIISLVIVLSALIWGICTFFQIGTTPHTDDAQIESYINPISTRIPGYIKEIRFSEHQVVHKGDTLVIIEDKEYKIQKSQAVSMLADAIANKDAAASGSDIAINAVNISDANLMELKARLLNLETNFKRYENLLKEDAVTRYQFDQVKTDLDAMRAKYNSLLAQYKSSQLNTSESIHRVSAADANIQKARAVVELADLNLSYTVVTAPYDGVMGRRNIEEGQLLQAGQTLVSIVRDDKKWITANFTEDQISKLYVGKSVQIGIDALSDKKYYGIITAISDATGSRYSAVPVDNSTGNFVKVQQRIPVKIEFTDKNDPASLKLLITGLNVEVNVK